MNVVVLTTETPHHAYFVSRLKESFGEVTAFCETREATIASNTNHPFERKRESYEWNRWFNGRATTVSELVPTQQFYSMNEPEALEALSRANPDVIIVFGTGILKIPVIEFCPNKIFNLHGGDPEYYRGLDTHLWAVYHREFNALIATLHQLDEKVDAGNIVLQGAIPLHCGMKLYHLRAANTEICTRLTESAIEMIKRHGNVTSRRQSRRGRNYSAIPLELMRLCQERFDEHISRYQCGE